MKMAFLAIYNSYALDKVQKYAYAQIHPNLQEVVVSSNLDDW